MLNKSIKSNLPESSDPRLVKSSRFLIVSLSLLDLLAPAAISSLELGALVEQSCGAQSKDE